MQSIMVIAFLTQAITISFSDVGTNLFVIKSYG